MLHELNCGPDGHAADRVRDGKYARLGNFRMGLEDQIYFGRLNLETSAIDFILDPTRQPNLAEIVNDTAISSAKPAITQNVCGKVGTIEITGHQAWRLHNDLALASPLKRPAVVDDGGGTAPSFPYQAVRDAVCSRRGTGDPIGCLGHTVAIDNLGTGPSRDLRP